jgi:hypothetical protein
MSPIIPPLQYIGVYPSHTLTLMADGIHSHIRSKNGMFEVWHALSILNNSLLAISSTSIAAYNEI